MSDAKLESVNLSSYEHKSTTRKFGEAAFEGIGTFLFVCLIYFTEGDVTKFAFGFWVILSVFGPISGAHVNPAITIGFYFAEQDWIYGLMKMGLYFLFQFIGAFAAVGLGVAINGEASFAIGLEKVAGKAFFAELFSTGTFFFIIAIATHAKYPPTKFGPVNCALIIGWFVSAVMVAGPLSGAALNPAVLLAVNTIANCYTKKFANPLKIVPSMLLGEVVGVILFAIIFKYVYCPMYESIQEEKEKSPEGYTKLNEKQEV